jgi:hypothetical protein
MSPNVLRVSCFSAPFNKTFNPILTLTIVLSLALASLAQAQSQSQSNPQPGMVGAPATAAARHQQWHMLDSRQARHSRHRHPGHTGNSAHAVSVPVRIWTEVGKKALFGQLVWE